MSRLMIVCPAARILVSMARPIPCEAPVIMMGGSIDSAYGGTSASVKHDILIRFH